MSNSQNPFEKPQGVPGVPPGTSPQGGQNPFAGGASMPTGASPMGNTGDVQNPFARPQMGQGNNAATPPVGQPNPYAAPQMGTGQPMPNYAPGMYPQAPPQGDATGGVIPYNNVPALIAYYLAVFSLIPCLGIVLGLVAVILGFVGLAKYKQNPQVHGLVHAWIGIIGGGLLSLGQIAILIVIMASATMRH